MSYKDGDYPQIRVYRMNSDLKGVGKMIATRMGDGSRTEMSIDDIKRDIENATNDAADRAGVAPLSKEDQDHLLEIICRKGRFVGVEAGKELVLTYDEGSVKLMRLGISIGRIQDLQMYERCFASDTAELAHVDYSFKPTKSIIHEEQSTMEQAQLVTTLPLFYGAMPNMALYSYPDGPSANPIELLPKGKIKEAQQAYEESIELMVHDLVFTSSKMYEAGADGINFDTTGSAGDADFYATLKATEILKKKYPNICIEMGMAGEFVLGMHGNLFYDGVKLAGLYPHEQVKIAQKAGVTIFGPVVNINSSHTFPYDITRAITMCKACTEASDIPIHANMGMGVGGIPIVDTPPIDALSRSSVAMAEIAKVDGL